MTNFLPAAYNGPQLRSAPPSLWLAPFYTVKRDAKTRPEHYLLLRNPYPSRGGSDGMHFAHILGRKVFPHELQVNAPNDIRINFDAAARNILGYYTGFELTEEPIVGTCLHHEGTNLFSGPHENQQVAVFLLCLNKVVKNADPAILPEIRTTTEGGRLPDAITGNEVETIRCNAYRQYVGWTPLSTFMASIVRTAPLNEAVYAPSETPFFARPYTVTKGGLKNSVQQTTPSMPVQGTILYVMQKAAEILHPNNPEIWLESNGRPRISEADMQRARQAPALLAVR